MRKLSMEELGRKTVAQFKETAKQKLVVVLDNVRSMHNVGSIFRTSDAFIIEKLWLCGFTPQPPHREIQKTALGATETVAWQYSESAVDCVTMLKAAGYTIFAVEQVADSQSIADMDTFLNTPVAVIFGNEVEGVQDEVLAHCDGALEIPQMGMKHSLNVSVAAGIVLFKLSEHLFVTTP